MGESLSLGIRERVVSLINEGLSCHEAARRLRILAASAVRIMQRKKRTGGVKAAQQAGCGLGNSDELLRWIDLRKR